MRLRKWVGLAEEVGGANVVEKMFLVALLFLLSASGESSVVEERLFESFLFNYSRAYKDDPHAKSLKFKVFQVSRLVSWAG